MASDPITSWKIKWEKVEAMTDFLPLGSQIAVEDDYSHEIRRQLLLGRKDITNLDSVLKSNDITLTTKVCIVKAMVFPVLMYRCEPQGHCQVSSSVFSALQVQYSENHNRVSHKDFPRLQSINCAIKVCPLSKKAVCIL